LSNLVIYHMVRRLFSSLAKTLVIKSMKTATKLLILELLGGIFGRGSSGSLAHRIQWWVESLA